MPVFRSGYRWAKLARSWRVVACFTAPLTFASTHASAGDPAAGHEVFVAQCSICHTTQAGHNALGPSLFGVVGRPSATAPRFAYSAAFKALDVTWDAATLDKYIADPKAMVPGTKMTYLGLKDDVKRADVIAYLATLK